MSDQGRYEKAYDFYFIARANGSDSMPQVQGNYIGVGRGGWGPGPPII